MFAAIQIISDTGLVVLNGTVHVEYVAGIVNLFNQMPTKFTYLVEPIKPIENDKINQL